MLANLGTPDAPTPKALRRYLRQFLHDRRVIELPRWQWLTILNLFVLPFRPRKSAALYRKVWTDDGSPLLVYAERQVAAVERGLEMAIGKPVPVALGMGYGSPSIPMALQKLNDSGCGKIVVLPLFPQYSGTTTATSFDAVFAELMTWRWMPEIRTIGSYHAEPAYIRALASTVRELWARDGEPERLLFSFHGVPKRYVTNGDPYQDHCLETGRLVAKELGLDEDRWLVAFQSQFGKEQWIRPTTDVTIRAMARAGTRRLDVICPGFSSDCLETIEEIGMENRQYFEENGGEQYRFIPCLNDRDDHIAALVGLLQRNMAGWIESS